MEENKIAEWFLRISLSAGFLSANAVLLILFAMSMTVSNSIKGPLDYSVFTA
jgi:hypothetical protein